MENVYVLRYGRKKYDFDCQEIWNDDELVKVRIRRIKEQQLKELEERKKMKWINKVKVRVDTFDCFSVEWYSIGDEKEHDKGYRLFVTDYKEMIIRGGLK